MSCQACGWRLNDVNAPISQHMHIAERVAAEQNICMRRTAARAVRTLAVRGVRITAIPTRGVTWLELLTEVVALGLGSSPGSCIVCDGSGRITICLIRRAWRHHTWKLRTTAFTLPLDDVAARFVKQLDLQKV